MVIHELQGDRKLRVRLIDRKIRVRLDKMEIKVRYYHTLIFQSLVVKHPSITFNMITTAKKHLDKVNELQNMNLIRVKA